MNISGIQGLTDDEISNELERGGKFVIYTYTISILIMTFKRPSDILFVKSHENRLIKGAKYSAVSLIFGWWGIPWGPVYTIGSIFGNSFGGKDVTKDILSSMAKSQNRKEVMKNNIERRKSVRSNRNN